jgi:hypothetical protein
MAAEQGTGKDMKAHEQTYAGFVRLIKIAVAISGTITLLVLFSLSR